MGAIYRDPLVQRYLGGATTTEQVVRAVDSAVKGFEHRGYGVFTIRDRVTGMLVGEAGIQNSDVGDGTLDDLHFALLPDARGRNVIQEAVPPLLDWFKARTGKPTVLAIIAESNAASLKRIGGLGFQFWKDWEFPRSNERELIYRLDFGPAPY